MPARETVRTVEPPLRCDHCGRAVRETQHTRTSYTVDYYSVYGGNGEVCSFAGELGQRGGTYVKLLDRFDCYRLESIQAERDRRFQPEREHDTVQGGA